MFYSHDFGLVIFYIDGRIAELSLEAIDGIYYVQPNQLITGRATPWVDHPWKYFCIPGILVPSLHIQNLRIRLGIVIAVDNKTPQI